MGGEMTSPSACWKNIMTALLNDLIYGGITEIETAVLIDMKQLVRIQMTLSIIEIEGYNK